MSRNYIYEDNNVGTGIESDGNTINGMTAEELASNPSEGGNVISTGNNTVIGNNNSLGLGEVTSPGCSTSVFTGGNHVEGNHNSLNNNNFIVPGMGGHYEMGQNVIIGDNHNLGGNMGRPPIESEENAPVENPVNELGNPNRPGSVIPTGDNTVGGDNNTPETEAVTSNDGATHLNTGGNYVGGNDNNLNTGGWHLPTHGGNQNHGGFNLFGEGHNISFGNNPAQGVESENNTINGRPMGNMGFYGRGRSVLSAEENTVVRGGNAPETEAVKSNDDGTHLNTGGNYVSGDDNNLNTGGWNLPTHGGNHNHGGHEIIGNDHQVGGTNGSNSSQGGFFNNPLFSMDHMIQSQSVFMASNNQGGNAAAGYAAPNHGGDLGGYMHITWGQ